MSASHCGYHAQESRRWVWKRIVTFKCWQWL